MTQPTRAFYALTTLTMFVLATTANAQSPAGTWTLYPSQASSYTTTVQQPINADGTSNFKSTGKAVIPIKFSLATGPGPVIFQSIGSDTDTSNDFSYLNFVPSTALHFSDITMLNASYSFTVGDCHGGSLRWSVSTSATQSVFIYYGVPPSFGNSGVGGCTPTSVGGSYQTGFNILSLTGARFDLSQYGGPFYGTYSDAIATIGSLPITSATLVLESGWQNAPFGDQRLTLTNAEINSNTFSPASGGTTATCVLPPATIQVTKTSGQSPGAVNEVSTIQPADNNSQFRVVGCNYMYNLDTSSLPGAGGYKVEAVINGTPAAGAASFDLR